MKYVVGNIKTLTRLLGLFNITEAKKVAKDESLSVHTVKEWGKAEKF